MPSLTALIVFDCLLFTCIFYAGYLGSHLPAILFFILASLFSESRLSTSGKTWITPPRWLVVATLVWSVIQFVLILGFTFAANLSDVFLTWMSAHRTSLDACGIYVAGVTGWYDWCLAIVTDLLLVIICAIDLYFVHGRAKFHSLLSYTVGTGDDDLVKHQETENNNNIVVDGEKRNKHGGKKIHRAGALPSGQIMSSQKSSAVLNDNSTTNSSFGNTSTGSNSGITSRRERSKSVIKKEQQLQQDESLKKDELVWSMDVAPNPPHSGLPFLLVWAALCALAAVAAPSYLGFPLFFLYIIVVGVAVLSPDLNKRGGGSGAGDSRLLKWAAHASLYYSCCLSALVMGAQNSLSRSTSNPEIGIASWKEDIHGTDRENAGARNISNALFLFLTVLVSRALIYTTVTSAELTVMKNNNKGNNEDNISKEKTEPHQHQHHHHPHVDEDARTTSWMISSLESNDMNAITIWLVDFLLTNGPFWIFPVFVVTCVSSPTILSVLLLVVLFVASLNFKFFTTFAPSFYVLCACISVSVYFVNVLTTQVPVAVKIIIANRNRDGAALPLIFQGAASGFAAISYAFFKFAEFVSRDNDRKNNMKSAAALSKLKNIYWIGQDGVEVERKALELDTKVEKVMKKLFEKSRENLTKKTHKNNTNNTNSNAAKASSDDTNDQNSVVVGDIRSFLKNQDDVVFDAAKELVPCLIREEFDQELKPLLLVGSGIEPSEVEKFLKQMEQDVTAGSPTLKNFLSALGTSSTATTTGNDRDSTDNFSPKEITQVHEPANIASSNVSKNSGSSEANRDGNENSQFNNDTSQVPSLRRASTSGNAQLLSVLKQRSRAFTISQRRSEGGSYLDPSPILPISLLSSNDISSSPTTSSTINSKNNTSPKESFDSSSQPSAAANELCYEKFEDSTAKQEQQQQQKPSKRPRKNTKFLLSSPEEQQEEMESKNQNDDDDTEENDQQRLVSHPSQNELEVELISNNNIKSTAKDNDSNILLHHKIELDDDNDGVLYRKSAIRHFLFASTLESAKRKLLVEVFASLFFYILRYGTYAVCVVMMYIVSTCQADLDTLHLPLLLYTIVALAFPATTLRTWPILVIYLMALSTWRFILSALDSGTVLEDWRNVTDTRTLSLLGITSSSQYVLYLYVGAALLSVAEWRLQHHRHHVNLEQWLSHRYDARLLGDPRVVRFYRLIGLGCLILVLGYRAVFERSIFFLLIMLLFFIVSALITYTDMKLTALWNIGVVLSCIMMLLEAAFQIVVAAEPDFDWDENCDPGSLCAKDMGLLRRNSNFALTASLLPSFLSIIFFTAMAGWSKTDSKNANNSDINNNHNNNDTQQQQQQETKSPTSSSTKKDNEKNNNSTSTENEEIPTSRQSSTAFSLKEGEEAEFTSLGFERIFTFLFGILNILERLLLSNLRFVVWGVLIFAAVFNPGATSFVYALIFVVDLRGFLLSCVSGVHMLVIYALRFSFINGHFSDYTRDVIEFIGWIVPRGQSTWRLLLGPMLCFVSSLCYINMKRFTETNRAERQAKEEAEKRRRATTTTATTTTTSAANPEESNLPSLGTSLLMKEDFNEPQHQEQEENNGNDDFEEDAGPPLLSQYRSATSGNNLRKNNNNGIKKKSSPVTKNGTAESLPPSASTATRVKFEMEYTSMNEVTHHSSGDDDNDDDSTQNEKVTDKKKQQDDEDDFDSVDLSTMRPRKGTLSRIEQQDREKEEKMLQAMSSENATESEKQKSSASYLALVFKRQQQEEQQKRKFESMRRVPDALNAAVVVIRNFVRSCSYEILVLIHLIGSAVCIQHVTGVMHVVQVTLISMLGRVAVTSNPTVTLCLTVFESFLFVAQATIALEPKMRSLVFHVTDEPNEWIKYLGIGEAQVLSIWTAFSLVTLRIMKQLHATALHEFNANRRETGGFATFQEMLSARNGIQKQLDETVAESEAHDQYLAELLSGADNVEPSGPLARRLIAITTYVLPTAVLTFFEGLGALSMLNAFIIFSGLVMLSNQRRIHWRNHILWTRWILFCDLIPWLASICNLPPVAKYLNQNKPVFQIIGFVNQDGPMTLSALRVVLFWSAHLQRRIFETFDFADYLREIHSSKLTDAVRHKEMSERITRWEKAEVAQAKKENRERHRRLEEIRKARFEVPSHATATNTVNASVAMFRANDDDDETAATSLLLGSTAHFNPNMNAPSSSSPSLENTTTLKETTTVTIDNNIHNNDNNKTEKAKKNKYMESDSDENSKSDEADENEEDDEEEEEEEEEDEFGFVKTREMPGDPSANGYHQELDLAVEENPATTLSRAFDRANATTVMEKINAIIEACSISLAHLAHEEFRNVRARYPGSFLRRLVHSFFLLVETHTADITLMIQLVNCANSGTIFDAVLPTVGLGFAFVRTPWPPSWYWRLCIIFSMISVVTKTLLSLLATVITLSPQAVHWLRVVIFKVPDHTTGGEATSGSLFLDLGLDFTILFFVLVHRYVSRRLGLSDESFSASSQASTALAKSFSENLVIRFGVGIDLYSLAVTIDGICFIIVLFGYYTLFPDDSSSSVLDSFKSNLLPGPLVVGLLGILVTVCIDRVVYLMQATRSKFAIHVVTVLAVHGVYIWWKNVLGASALTGTFLLLLKQFGCYLSATQLKLGYPLVRQHDPYSSRPYPPFSYLYPVYRGIPFLFEMRSLLDWTFTRTALPCHYWIKLEDIAHEVYNRDIDRFDHTKTNPTPGFPTKFIWKFVLGFLVFIGLFFVMFFPLMYYSTFNPSLQDNEILEAEVQLTFNSISTWFRGRISQKVQDPPSQEWISLVHPVFTEAMRSAGSKVEFFDIAKCSTFNWQISPPALKDLRNRLTVAAYPQNYSGSSFDALVFRNTIDIKRKGSVTSEGKTASFVTDTAMTADNAKALLVLTESMNQTNSIINRNYIANNGTAILLTRLRVEKFWKPIISSDPNVATLFPKLQTDCVVEFFASVDPRTSELVQYSCVSCAPLFSKGNFPNPSYPEYKDCLDADSASRKCGPFNFDKNSTRVNTNVDSLYFYVVNERVPTESSFLPNVGIIALYTTFVIAIWRVVRGLFSGMAFRVVLEDMTDPDKVKELIDLIYLSRESRRADALLLEEALYFELLDMLRGPDALLKVTGLRSAAQLNHGIMLEQRKQQQQQNHLKKN